MIWMNRQFPRRDAINPNGALSAGGEAQLLSPRSSSRFALMLRQWQLIWWSIRYEYGGGGGGGIITCIAARGTYAIAFRRVGLGPVRSGRATLSNSHAAGVTAIAELMTADICDSAAHDRSLRTLSETRSS